jgi:integrase
MLSDLRIRNLKPGGKDRWLSDGDRSGLYIRVRATGGKSWVLRRREGNITLGPFGDGETGLTLRQARLKAAEHGARHRPSLTFGELLDQWYADIVSKTYRRPQEVAAYFERLEPGLKATKLRDLDRLAVRHALRRYAEKRGPVGANRLLSILRTALRFAVNAGYLISSPIEGLTPDLVGGTETTRERVLSDEEICELWQAESQHLTLLRFLLLTGQRIGEAQRATWSHVSKDRWHIPAEHSKNHRAHWVALSRQTLALLGAQAQRRVLVFGTATDTGVQAWLRRWCERKKISPAFTPHDLRRTFATRVNSLGVMPHIVEKILNHTMQGVMAVYNRAEYETERADAMQRWADALDRIIATAP